jgi:hypothetical protein
VLVEGFLCQCINFSVAAGAGRERDTASILICAAPEPSQHRPVPMDDQALLHERILDARDTAFALAQGARHVDAGPAEDWFTPPAPVIFRRIPERQSKVEILVLGDIKRGAGDFDSVDEAHA